MTETYSEEIGLDDESVTSNNFDKYKGVKGKTDRIALVYPKIRRAMTQFIENVGYVIANDYTITRFGAPTQRFAAIVAVYKTDNFGKLVTPFNEHSVTLKYWVFSAKRYESIRSANKEFPLENHDLQVTCTEDKYQQLNLQSCKEVAWKLKPEIEKYVSAQAEKMAKHLEAQLGQILTAEQIKEKLGEGSSAEASDAALTNDVSADSVLENI